MDNEQPSVAAAAPSSQQPTILARYRDAYAVARVTVGLGSTIKGIGIIAGIVLILVSLSSSRGLGNAALIPLVLSALGCGIVYILGLLVAAVGQILKATLDSAVNTSAFLSDEQRSEMMSL